MVSFARLSHWSAHSNCGHLTSAEVLLIVRTTDGSFLTINFEKEKGPVARLTSLLPVFLVIVHIPPQARLIGKRGVPAPMVVVFEELSQTRAQLSHRAVFP